MNTYTGNFIRAACFVLLCPQCKIKQRILLGILADEHGTSTCLDCGNTLRVSQKEIDDAIKAIKSKYETERSKTKIYGELTGHKPAITSSNLTLTQKNLVL